MSEANRKYYGFVPILLNGETREIHISIDLNELAYVLGPKANRNKSKQSSALSGAIRVEARNVGYAYDKRVFVKQLGEL
jgi:hypothetical protein